MRAKKALSFPCSSTQRCEASVDPEDLTRYPGVRRVEHPLDCRGDLLGLLSGVAMAGYLTACRHATLHKPEAPMVLGVAIGSLCSAFIGMYLATARGLSLLDVPTNLWPLLLADCLGIALYGEMHMPVA